MPSGTSEVRKAASGVPRGWTSTSLFPVLLTALGRGGFLTGNGVCPDWLLSFPAGGGPGGALTSSFSHPGAGTAAAAAAADAAVVDRADTARTQYARLASTCWAEAAEILRRCGTIANGPGLTACVDAL